MMRIRRVAVGAVLLTVVLLCGCGRPGGSGTEDRSSGAHDGGASTGAGGKGGESVAEVHSNVAVALTLSAMDEAKYDGVGDLGTLSLLTGTPAPATAEEAVAPVMGASASTRGILLLRGGSTYEGEVTDGKPSGQGTLTDANGTHQWGMWHDGNAYTLRGTWVAPDGTTEVGTWNLDGTPSGWTITWKDGRQYKGDWKLVEGAAELPDGTGEMNWPDGRKYVGQFHNGTMDGPGKMTYPDGNVEEGNWKQGRFLRPVP